MAITRLRALPAHLRAEPGPPARPPQPAPRRRPGLGQARGLQLRPRLRRQQDPQAGVHRPRRARRRAPTRSCRSAATSPTTPARSPPSRRKLGLKCRLVQEKWVDWDDPVNDKVGNILLSRIMGADVRLDPPGFDIGIRQSWEDALAEVEASGGKPYAIPAGASEHKLGGLGFANWAYEVAEQEKELGVFFDTIVVCTVTGSTHAGMIAGFAALEDAGGRPRRVHRHRRLRHDRQDPRPGRPDRPQHGRAHRPRARPARRRDHRPRGLGRRPLRHPRRVDDRGHQAVRPSRGHDHRPRLRGEVDGRPHRPGQPR